MVGGKTFSSLMIRYTYETTIIYRYIVSVKRSENKNETLLPHYCHSS